MTTLYAHYYTGTQAGQRVHYIYLTESTQPVGGKRRTVAGKKEARQLAAKLHATPWNF